MKDKTELENLKKEYEELTTKLKELNEEELNEVTGGVQIWDIGVKLKEKFNIQNSNDSNE